MDIQSANSPQDLLMAAIDILYLRDDARKLCRERGIIIPESIQNLTEESRFNLMLVQSWIQNGVDVQFRGNIFLSTAALNGYDDLVVWAFDQGVNIQEDIDSALRNAARFKNLRIVKILADRGADVNAKNGEPLRWACRNGHTEMAHYLLAIGADVDSGNGEALYLAIHSENFDLAIDMLDKGADLELSIKLLNRLSDQKIMGRFISYYEEIKLSREVPSDLLETRSRPRF